jgi:hypothetical protein
MNFRSARRHVRWVICRLTHSGITASLCPQSSNNGHKSRGKIIHGSGAFHPLRTAPTLMLTGPLRATYFTRSMSSRSRIRGSAERKTKAARLRSWRASLIRKRAQVVGIVEAPSREAAEAAAVRTFNLNDEQRSRLVVQERS